MAASRRRGSVRSPCRRLTENSTVYTLIEAHRSPPRRIVPAIARLPERDNRAFPFCKVRKQMRNGLDGGDSILGFSRAMPEFLKMQHEKK